MATGPVQRLAVLFVDDDENWLRAMRRTLAATKEPIDILTESSPGAALELAAGRPLGVVVADYKMPEMDGVRFLEQLRQRQPASYRIILSGYPDPRLYRAAINRAQVHRFIEKPADGRVIADAVLEGLRYIGSRCADADLCAALRLQQATIDRQRELLRQVAERCPDALPADWERDD